MESVQYKMSTPAGGLYLVASPKGIQKILFHRQTEPMIQKLDPMKPAHRWLSRAIDELNEYFEGKRKKFEFPLDLQGTDFQKKVWMRLRKIPFGQTCSYKDIAVGIGKPGATRAVGNANGQNSVCIVIPCHRVIAADGSIGGYSGGLQFKRRLLKVEGIQLKGESHV